MTRTRVGLVLAVAALGLAGLTACGAAQRPVATDSVEVSSALSADGQALAAMGFDTQGAVTAQLDPAPSASAARPGRDRARVLLRRNVLHGEAVVQTKDGPRTITVQRGTLTEVTGTSITVRSTDGYTATWTFGDPLTVREKRAAITAGDLRTGQVVGVAGSKDVARLIVVAAA